MNEKCPVCDSMTHIHCSTGCEICDVPSNPTPVFAEGRCKKCRKLLCWNCLDDHECSYSSDVEPPHQPGCICADCSGAELTADND